MQTETHTHTHTLLCTQKDSYGYTKQYILLLTHSPLHPLHCQGPNSEINQGLLELHMEEDTIERKRDVRGGDVRKEDGK